jgi:type II secretory pathway component PulJ
LTKRLTKPQGAAVVAALTALVLCSLWLNQQQRAVQLNEKKALYGERLRTAQVILENEMLAAAYLTTADPKVRERARFYLERSPQ